MNVLEQVFTLKDLLLSRGPLLEQACPEGLQAVGLGHSGLREKHEEKGTPARSCCGLSTIHCAHPSVLLRVGGEVEKPGMEE